MTTTVFTDPHLGRTMQAHTTASSRARLTASIYDTTLGSLRGAPVGPKVCLGDLFDKFQNPEHIIQQGLNVASYCDRIMAGNHDVTNDRTKIGSLQLLAGVAQNLPNTAEVLIVPFGQAECYLKEIDGKDFIFIPHHTTDTLFAASLKDAEDWARNHRLQGDKTKTYLCLHCNYDSGFATDETALSLTRKEAKTLLEAGFDYIVIGHDHHPREDFDGRVIILGNMHPTGFGDITHKRMLQINDDGSHDFVTVWSPEEKYALLDVNKILGVAVADYLEVVPDFIEIEGTISPDRVLDLAKAIRALWALEPMAIRNKVEIEKVGAHGSVNHDFASIDKVVLEDLADEPELRDLFLSYWNKTVVAVEGE